MTDTARLVAHIVGSGLPSRADNQALQRADALVRQLPLPLIFVDSRGVEVIVNEQGRLLLGLSSEEGSSGITAEALARLLQRHDCDDAGVRRLAADPQARLSFKIRENGRDLKVDSHWIEDEVLRGRFWMFSDVTHERGLQKQLIELASRDALTGLLNRRSFDEHLAAELEQAKRFRWPLSLLVLDLDHFKSINDSFGHLAGDMVLQEASNLIAQTVRARDVAARTGGEEFAILAPDTPLTGALDLAERLRSTISQTKFIHAGTPLRVTCSIGVSECASHSDTPASLTGRADNALYGAKRLGRNRVEPNASKDSSIPA